jgi:hypothetical protein
MFFYEVRPIFMLILYKFRAWIQISLIRYMYIVRHCAYCTIGGAQLGATQLGAA